MRACTVSSASLESAERVCGVRVASSASRETDPVADRAAGSAASQTQAAGSRSPLVQLGARTGTTCSDGTGRKPALVLRVGEHPPAVPRPALLRLLLPRGAALRAVMRQCRPAPVRGGGQPARQAAAGATPLASTGRQSSARRRLTRRQRPSILGRRARRRAAASRTCYNHKQSVKTGVINHKQPHTAWAAAQRPPPLVSEKLKGEGVGLRPCELTIAGRPPRSCRAA